MAPPFLAAWREQRRLRRSAASYVRTLLMDPDDVDVSWLSDVATRGDSDRARWELRYARRATGLLSAERDALDDRTASAVARELGESWSKDPNIAADMRHAAEQQFNARLRTLGQAINARSSPEPTGARLGKALLFVAGLSFPDQARHRTSWSDRLSLPGAGERSAAEGVRHRDAAGERASVGNADG